MASVYTGVLCPELIQQFWNQTATQPAAPVGGASYVVYSYLAGTTTPTPTYPDASLGIIGAANPNPVELNAAGQTTMFLNPLMAYKFVYTTSNDTDPPTSPIYTQDNIWPPLSLNSLTQSVLAPIVFPAITAEAGVTISAYQYQPGDLRRYGADPTGTLDSTQAIQAAYTVQQASSSVAIFVDGTFLYTPVARVDVDGLWYGVGKAGSVIKVNSSVYNSGDYFRVTGHGVLRDMTISLTVGTLVGTGVYLAYDPDTSNTGDIRVSGLQVSGFNINYEIGYVEDVVLDRCDGLNGNYGEYCVPNPSGTGFANTVTHINCNFQGNGCNVYWAPTVNCNCIEYYGGAIQDATGVTEVGGVTTNAYFGSIATLKLAGVYCEGTACTNAFNFAGVGNLRIDLMDNQSTGAIVINNVNTKALLSSVTSTGILSAGGSSTPVALTLENCTFPSSSNTFNTPTTVIINTSINGSSTAYSNIVGGALAVANGTALTAGGAIAMNIGASGSPGIYFGSGAPTISAVQGSFYLRSDGSSTSTRLYVNSSSGSGTTWAAVTTAS